MSDEIVLGISGRCMRAGPITVSSSNIVTKNAPTQTINGNLILNTPTGVFNLENVLQGGVGNPPPEGTPVDLTEVKQDISDLEEATSLLDGRVSALEVDYGVLQGETVALDNRVEEIENTLPDSFPDFTDMNNRITTNTNDIADLPDDLDEYDGRITTNTNAISNISDELSGFPDLDQLVLDVNGNTTTIGNLPEDLSNFESRITDNRQEVDNITNMVGTSASPNVVFNNEATDQILQGGLRIPEYVEDEDDPDFATKVVNVGFLNSKTNERFETLEEDVDELANTTIPNLEADIEAVEDSVSDITDLVGTALAPKMVLKDEVSPQTLAGPLLITQLIPIGQPNFNEQAVTAGYVDSEVGDLANLVSANIALIGTALAPNVILRNEADEQVVTGPLNVPNMGDVSDPNYNDRAVNVGYVNSSLQDFSNTLNNLSQQITDVEDTANNLVTLVGTDVAPNVLLTNTGLVQNLSGPVTIPEFDLDDPDTSNLIVNRGVLQKAMGDRKYSRISYIVDDVILSMDEYELSWDSINQQIVITREAGHDSVYISVMSKTYDFTADTIALNSFDLPTNPLESAPIGTAMSSTVRMKEITILTDNDLVEIVARETNGSAGQQLTITTHVTK